MKTLSRLAYVYSQKSHVHIIGNPLLANHKKEKMIRYRSIISMQVIVTRVILFGFLFAIRCYDITAQTPNYTEFDQSTIKGTPGYFRVAKTFQGQWWFLDPENKPFYYKGICAVNRAGTPGGRRANPGAYAKTVDKKYNYQVSSDSFVKACLRKIYDLNFNALGAWTTEEFFNYNVPFTEIIEFFKEGPFLPSVNGKNSLPDIFHPAWHIAADRKARALCSPLRYSKWLVGYFTDNEIGFGKADDFGFDVGFNAGQFDFSLLRIVLGMNPGEPAFEFAWDFILDRHNNSFNELSAAWQIDISTKEDVKTLNALKKPIPGKSYHEDAQAFVELYAKKYFEIAYQCIRRYDPNHLILGCRFGSPPPKCVLDAILPYTDVISVNNYQPILYERYDTVYQYTGLPLLIGEFSWNTDLYKKVPLPNETVPLTLKDRMFERGSTTLLRTALHPGIIGYTWYRWVQEASTENIYYDGIVNYGDSLEMHAAMLQKINSILETVRVENAEGEWKNTPITTGEYTLFFEYLRPDWFHFIRFSIKNNRPNSLVYGWQMSGKILAFSQIKNHYHIKLSIDFKESAARNKTFESGKGVYELDLVRNGEKFYGQFKGNFNGKAMEGKVRAFFFPPVKPTFPQNR